MAKKFLTVDVEQAPRVPPTSSKKSSYYTTMRRSIVDTFKKQARAALALNAFCFLLVTLFYSSDSVRASCSRLGAFRASAGFGFSALSTSLFGGLLPLLITMYSDASKRSVDYFVKRGTFFCLLWAYKGVEVDCFYRLQSSMFGSDASASTIIKKVLFDELVYSPCWACWSLVLVTRWEKHDFSLEMLKSDIISWSTFWTIDVPIVQISSWLIWFPAVIVIYSLPADLQIPLFNMTLLFFAILLGALNDDGTTRGKGDAVAGGLAVQDELEFETQKRPPPIEKDSWFDDDDEI